MTPDTENPHGTRVATAVLAVCCALIAGQRLHTFDEPLERDLTTYAIVAHEVLLGRALYSEVWDHKPPAVYATYGLAELIAGYGPRAIYVLGVGAAVVTLFAVFRIASSLAGATGGLWAAVFWTLLCSNVRLQANQPNTEVFMNACTAWAAALLLRAEGTRWLSPRVLGAGALLTLATMYKPVIVSVAGAIALAHVLLPPPSRGRRRALVDAVTISATIAAGWAAIVLYFRATGRLEDFRYAIVTFNEHYAGDAFANLRALADDARRITEVPGGILLLVATVIGTAIGVREGRARAWVMLVTALVGAHVAAVLPGKGFIHYYQLWLPWLAAGAGAGIVGATAALRVTWRRPALVAAGLTLAFPPARDVVAALRLSPAAISYGKYGNYFVASADLGRQIDHMLQPGETFYEWGSETGLYFYSGRRPPAGVFYNIPLMSGDGRRRLRTRVLEELAAAPPELLVVIKDALPLDERVTLLKWMSEQYVPLPSGRGRRGPFMLYVRRGGRLDTERSLELRGGT